MRRALLLLAIIGISSCDAPESKPKTDGEKLEGKEATVAPAPLAELTPEELRDLSRDPSDEATATFERLLYGGDDARRFAPLALGLRCDKNSADEMVPRLLGAASSWSTEKTPGKPENLRTLAWAIGACANDESEKILRYWLTPSGRAMPPGLTDAAIFGLSGLADRKGTLDERTQTAVLDAAARFERPDYLLPLGRIARLSEAVGAHILEVAGKLLTIEGKGSRRHTIFALGSAGPSAAEPLGQVLLADSYSPEERAAAAQALARLGGAGQKVLDETLKAMLARGLPTAFDRVTWIPLRASVESLEVTEASKKQLTEIGAVVLPEGKERAKVAQRRRLIWLRCQAASLLAQGRPETTTLLACDPDKGRDFHLAQLKVLDTERIDKKRHTLFVEKTKHTDPAVAQAAIRMIASHPEIDDSPELLLAALETKSPGTQAAAAQVIGAYPARAHGKGEADEGSERIVAALRKLLELPSGDIPAETRAAVIKASGALAALSLKPLVENFCKGSIQAYWEPAARALELLGEAQAECPGREHDDVDWSDTFEPTTLVIDSDVGELVLHVDGQDAPTSARHFLKLVESGAYDGMAIHASRPGFAVQFGDADGDGYQDKPSDALPHEVSPETFSEMTFGMSAFSPGSHDRQIFVVVSDAPQLYASRVWLGRAEGPWHLLTVGDVLHSIRKKP